MENKNVLKLWLLLTLGLTVQDYQQQTTTLIQFLTNH